jgi:NAD-dependent deacetylase
VHPVAGLVDLALGSGARVVIINAEPTPYDDDAHAVLREPISVVLPDLVAAVGTLGPAHPDERRA